MKGAIRARGLDALDGRTRAALALKNWRAELVRDLGGEDAVSAQQLALVELCCRDRAILDHVDGWLLAQPSIVNKSKRRLFDVVTQRQSISNALAAKLNMLGLEKRGAPVQDLTAYVEEKYGRK